MLFSYLLATGLTTGALYALVAVGLVICYRTTGHINFAHGELFMVGGYIAFSLHVLMNVPYVYALVLAVFSSGLLGLICDRAVFRPLISAPPMAMVVATVALSFLLRGAARVIWGGLGEYVPFPPIVDPSPISFWGVAVFPQQLTVVASVAVCMLLITLFFRSTRVGKTMKAVAESPRASYLVGIKVEKVYALTWMLSAALAAVSAVLMAPLTQLTPDIGFGLLLKAFAATILGGLGSMPGAVLGGLVVGICESFAAGYISSSLQEVMAFILIMVVLIVRPTGLFNVHSPREV
jgi:branched-chain amino acid transport system permease protein